MTPTPVSPSFVNGAREIGASLSHHGSNLIRTIVEYAKIIFVSLSHHLGRIKENGGAGLSALRDHIRANPGQLKAAALGAVVMAAIFALYRGCSGGRAPQGSPTNQNLPLQGTLA